MWRYLKPVIDQVGVSGSRSIAQMIVRRSGSRLAGLLYCPHATVSRRGQLLLLSSKSLVKFVAMPPSLWLIIGAVSVGQRGMELQIVTR